MIATKNKLLYYYLHGFALGPLNGGVGYTYSSTKVGEVIKSTHFASLFNFRNKAQNGDQSWDQWDIELDKWCLNRKKDQEKNKK